MTLELEEQDRPCVICKRQGIRKPVEILPDGGIKWRVIHDDGKKCEWESYEDIKQMLPKRPSKKKSKPQVIICPVCDQKGTVNAYLDKGSKGGTWRYRIRHSDINPPYHHITTQEQRDKVLEQIGRNIKVKETANGPITKVAVAVEPQQDKKRGRGRPPKPDSTEIEQAIDEEFFNLIKQELESHKARKKELLIKYAQRHEKEGIIPLHQINDHITKKLKGLISPSYVRVCLPDKYKDPDQKRRSHAGATNKRHRKKQKWNIEQAYKLSKKQLIEICKAARDKWGKPFDQLANKTLQELK